MLVDFKIDRESFVPIYQQIKNWILTKIDGGYLAKGDAIPSVTVLSNTLGVSRATVRQAFYELRIAGYLVQEKGHGIFYKRRFPS